MKKRKPGPGGVEIFFEGRSGFAGGLSEGRAGLGRPVAAPSKKTPGAVNARFTRTMEDRGRSLQAHVHASAAREGTRPLEGC